MTLFRQSQCLIRERGREVLPRHELRIEDIAIRINAGAHGLDKLLAAPLGKDGARLVANRRKGDCLRVDLSHGSNCT